MTPDEILQAMRGPNLKTLKKELERRYKKAQKGDVTETAFLEELGRFFLRCKESK